MEQVKSRSIEETQAFGEKLAQILPKPSIVAFFGDLGAGKTTLIKSYVSFRTALKSDEISSPTFQILHIYNDLYHFDLWRVSNADEFLALGFDEYLDGKHDVCIEWSERIEPILPHNTCRVHIQALSENERQITYGF